MKIKDVTIEILGGKEQIGGNIILVEYQGIQICLDIGMPLEGSVHEAGSSDVLKARLSKVDYCLISHAHQDHWGHLELLPTSCIIYSGRETQTLIRITRFITKMPFVDQAWHDFKSGKLNNSV